MVLQPASIAIILDEESQSVLLVQRRDVPVWVLPGGGIESAETAPQALYREVKEETGLDVAIIRKCAEYTPINSLAAFTYLFLCKKVGGQEEIGEESAAVAFFPLQALPSTLFFVHRIWLEESLKSKQTIYRPLSEVTYAAVFKYLLQHPLQLCAYLYTRLKGEKK